MKILEKEVIDFIRNYVSALKMLVEEKHQQIESTGIRPWFPTEFPVKAFVFLGKRGVIVNFDRADHFDVSVKRDERPHTKSKWGEFIPYPRFARIKDKASEKAESDIKHLLSLPKMIEEQEQEMQSYYEALWIEDMRYTAEHYVEFLSKAKEVVDKTKEAAIQELYDIVTVIQNHLSNYEYMLRVGCKALDRLYFMINSDLETSLFLALHGKYYSAMAILRKVLEVNIRCVYLDSLQNRVMAERQIDGWINGRRFPKKLVVDTVNGIINDQVDQSLTSLLKRLTTFENGSFKQSILSLYRELCVFVHLRPLTRWDADLKLSFSEFNLGKWRNYYLLFMKVIKLAEILLILKFSRIVSMPGLVDPTETYKGLQLSKQELDAIAKFSVSYS